MRISSASAMAAEWMIVGTSTAASNESPTGTQLPGPVGALLVVTLLYVFLGGVKLLETGIKGLGDDFTDRLFDNVANPLAALIITNDMMKGWMFQNAIKYPRIIPDKIPMVRPTRHASIQFTPKFAIRSALVHPDTAIIEPTERSIPPEMMA